jgi:hypothetical protein
MNDEGLLANGVSATERGETSAGRSCFVNDEGLLIKVFQQQRRTSKQVLDGVVSAMETVRKWRGWEEMKNAEQWCFSIGKTDERLLVTVFQQWEEK